MTTDDFENPDSTPVPPYDRSWRHPAEMADAQRSLHLGSAPPLGRRLTALTVIASTFASIAVLAVAIPKGIEDAAQANDEPDITTTVPPTAKGASNSSLAVVRGAKGSTTALSLGNGRWLVSSEALAATGPSQTNPAFSVEKSDDVVGLSVIRVTNNTPSAPATDFTHLHEQLPVNELAKYKIFDAFQDHDVAPEPSLIMSSKDHAQPVNMKNPIKGVAVVVDDDQRLVGILVRHHHSEWSVTRRALLSLTAP